MRRDDSDSEHHDEQGHVHEHKTAFAEYVRLALLAAVIIASLTGWWKHFMGRDWLAFAATLVGGYPIFQEASNNLCKRRMTMDLSMTIALVAALCIGQFFTALVIAFFVLFAELLEGYTVGGGRRAMEKLIESLPRQVTVRRDGQERELSTAGDPPGRDHHHSAWFTHPRRRRGVQGPQLRGSIPDHWRIAAHRNNRRKQS